MIDQNSPSPGKETNVLYLELEALVVDGVRYPAPGKAQLTYTQTLRQAETPRVFIITESDTTFMLEPLSAELHAALQQVPPQTVIAYGTAHDRVCIVTLDQYEYGDGALRKHVHQGNAVPFRIDFSSREEIHNAV